MSGAQAKLLQPTASQRLSRSWNGVVQPDLKKKPRKGSLAMRICISLRLPSLEFKRHMLKAAASVALLLGCAGYSAESAAGTGVREQVPEPVIVNFADIASREALHPEDIRAALQFVPSPAHRAILHRSPVSKRVDTAPIEAAPLDFSSGLQSLPPASNFQGTQFDGALPPDTDGAVGPNHLVIAINGQFKVQDRSGNTVSVATLSSFWQAATPPQCIFDPRIYYDSLASRWITIAAAYDSTAPNCASKDSNSRLLLGVSTTDDPTKPWRLYNFDFDANHLTWADFPNVGFNGQWLVIAADVFPFGGETADSRIIALDKAAMYAGSPSNYKSFVEIGHFDNIPVASLDNSASPMYFVNWVEGAATDSLRISTITGIPASGNETFNLGTATASSSFASNSVHIDDPQLGGPNLGGGHTEELRPIIRNGTLWCVHRVTLPADTSPNRVSIEWWQVAPGTGQILQLGRLDDPTGTWSYDYPSIAVNKNNDVLIGYSVFSAGSYAGAGYSMRLAIDSPSTIRLPFTFKSGETPYLKPGSRWGDYSATAVDPLNDLDMWTLQEYAANPGNTWGLWWASVTFGPSIVTSPTPGSTLSSASATFNWTPGTDVTQRYLQVGTSAGGSDLYAAYEYDALSQAVSGLPTNGSTIYVRLMSWINGGWQYHDYTYTAAAPVTPVKSAITSPAPGSTFSSSTATFTWDAGVGVTQRFLQLGSTQGGSDIYGAYEYSALSQTVSGLPTNGSVIFVRLMSWINGGWQYNDYAYTAAGGAPVKSLITTPGTGSTFDSTTVQFAWNTGVGVTQRYLQIGTTQGGSDLYAAYEYDALSQTVSGLPRSGIPLYVRLMSWINGGWQLDDRTYTTVSGPASVITSPASRTLTSSASTFSWDSGTGVTQRYLSVGTALGSSDIYAAYEYDALSQSVSGLPTNGSLVYVRLMSWISGGWQYRDYVYHAATQ